MLGCFRKGEANDPETYVAALTAVLSEYPEDIIIAVTHPAKGLPIAKDFLPSVHEVHEACEEHMRPIREVEARSARIRKQLAEREEWERDRSAR